MLFIDFNRRALLESRKLIDDPNAVPYDLSKADGQKVVLQFCEKGLDASIIHPTSIVGPNDFKPGLPMQEMVTLPMERGSCFLIGDITLLM